MKSEESTTPGWASIIAPDFRFDNRKSIRANRNFTASDAALISNWTVSTCFGANHISRTRRQQMRAVPGTIGASALPNSKMQLTMSETNAPAGRGKNAEGEDSLAVFSATYTKHKGLS
jgi:hypothetical protein